MQLDVCEGRGRTHHVLCPADKVAEEVKDKTILELGAGTGAVGLAASLLGAQSVLLTDLPHLVPCLQANIQVSSTPAAHTAAALHACCPHHIGLPAKQSMAESCSCWHPAITGLTAHRLCCRPTACSTVSQLQP